MHHGVRMEARLGFNRGYVDSPLDKPKLLMEAEVSQKNRKRLGISLSASHNPAIPAQHVNIGLSEA